MSEWKVSAGDSVSVRGEVEITADEFGLVTVSLRDQDAPNGHSIVGLPSDDLLPWHSAEEIEAMESVVAAVRGLVESYVAGNRQRAEHGIVAMRSALYQLDALRSQETQG